MDLQATAEIPRQRNHPVSFPDEELFCINSDQHSHLSKPPQNKPKQSAKKRKVRTMITAEKLAEMNEIFAQYRLYSSEGLEPPLKLRQICRRLNLGYSTVLHKHREFRLHNEVKGGALIASLQKKRKYPKSMVIQTILDQALACRPFYTTVELSKFITVKCNISYSRSIISRHLNEMGYGYNKFKNKEINSPAYKQMRRMFAAMVMPMDEHTIFLGHVLYTRLLEAQITILLALTLETLVSFTLVLGALTMEQFCEETKKILRNCREPEKTKVVVDVLDMKGEVQFPQQICIIPPHSSKLTPMNGVLREVVSSVRKMGPQNYFELQACVSVAVKSIHRFPPHPQLQAIQKWMHKALEQHDF